MRMYDIITNKKNGKELSKLEIDYFISGYVNGNIPDYQISALMMAIWFNNLTIKETILLTKAMINSGKVVDISNNNGIKVDKHSTGGIGDKTSLVLLPILASNNLIISKMSGRGLGYTGGTLDKLESIYGFNINLEPSDVEKIINENGYVICGQTNDLVPADKKLYSLRDTTATVDNIQLIASSIMSKKLASGSDYILLDVKLGSGAFMKDLDDSIELSKSMVAIGKSFGKKVRTVITNMDQPLGNSVGNSLEVIEAIETLKNNGPEDFINLCNFLAANIFEMTGLCSTIEEGKKLADNSITSGKALNRFKKFIELQNGDINVIENYDIFDKAKHVIKIKSLHSGFVNNVNAEQIGKASLLSGAGREKKEDNIDYSSGVILNKKVNDKINKGDILAEFHTNKSEEISDIEKIILSAYQIDPIKQNKNKLIYGIVDEDGFKEYN